MKFSLPSRLPSNYQEVAYIDGLGSQYIKTGIVTDITAKYEIAAVFYYFEDYPSNEAIFGTTTMEYLVNHGWLDNSKHKHYYRRNYSTGEVYITMDGSVIYNTPDNNKQSEEIYLFATNHGGTPVQFSLYSFVSMTIKENDVLIADYVPCYRKSDGEIGLYDLVTKTFLTNDGTGAFTKGVDTEYQAVEYIETSDGTSAYIDTGFTTNINMKIEVDAQAFGSTELFIGAMPLSGSEDSNFTIGRVNNTMGYLCWNNAHIYGNYGDWSTRSKAVVYQSGGSIHYILNGTDTTIAVVSPALQSAANLYLFRRNDGGSPSSIATSKIRLFGCKLWSGDTLSRNFVPCYRTSDSEIGLYDLVNGVFYTNIGTGTFTKGADIVLSKINLNPRIPAQYQALDFIQSTGSEYIDTGVCIYDYYDKIKMEVDMQLTPGVAQNEYCYQGAGMAGSSGYYFSIPGFWTGNNNIDVSIGNSNTANCVHTFANARDTYRHKIYVDAYNGECGFDDDTYTGLEYSSISSGLGSGNINLFAIRSYSESARNYIRMCLYGCVITDMSTNTKLRDFVPCYRVSDGVIGLYDLVTETFFTNQGNGAFVKGGEKSVFQIKDANGNVIWKNNEEIEFVYDNESASHYTDQGGDCLFDGDPNTKWCANYVNGMRVAFHTNRPIAPMSYSLMTGSDTASYPGRNPISWKLYGKARMEGNWVLINSHTNDSTMGATNNQWYDFQISNPNSDLYRYFYIEVDAIASDSVLQIAELKIHETRVTDRYQEVEYVSSSDGHQYINTGINAYSVCDKLRVEMDCLIPNVTQLTYGGSGCGNYGGYYGYYLKIPGSIHSSSPVWGSGQYDNAFVSIANDYQRHLMIVDCSTEEVFCDSTRYTFIKENADQDYGSIFLFAYGKNDVYQNGAIYELYSCKFYYDSNLIRDFVPCYRKSDDVIGMYDLVTGTFFTNAGSGTFTKGNDV